MKAGDVIECITGSKLRIVSTEGFRLLNDGEHAKYLLIAEETGELEGYAQTLEQIENEYFIREVHSK